MTKAGKSEFNVLADAMPDDCVYVYLLATSSKQRGKRNILIPLKKALLS